MTNEEYLKAIEMRSSRRTYKSGKLDAGYVDVINNIVDYVNDKSGLKLIFVEDGSLAFTVFTGRFGVIALCGSDTEKDRVAAGYYGETIVLQCTYHGLGTCWVTGTYNENKIYELVDVPKDLRLYGVITVGYCKDKKSVKENAMYNVLHKKNKPYQKMFTICDKKLPDEYKFAMGLVEKAPSATNRRCVEFKYENDLISASVDAPYSDKSLDLGIAELHFQLGAAAKGIKGEWNFKGEFIVSNPEIIKFPKTEVTENE